MKQVPSLTLEQIEVRMDMLIQQTKMHFLEMGNLLIEARKIFDKKGKKYSEYCEYVERQFGFKETAHRYMRDVCERFNGKSQELLDLYISKQVGEEFKTKSEAIELAIERFKITNNTIKNLTKVYRTFGKNTQQHLLYLKAYIKVIR